MAIILSKRQSTSLAKTTGSSLSQISMSLGWNSVKSKTFLGKLLGSGGFKIDLDASCLLPDRNKHPVDFAWLPQLKAEDSSVKHSGDNRTARVRVTTR